MAKCLVSLGSNLGNQHAAFDKAIEALIGLAEPGTLLSSSRRETVPIGGPAVQSTFLNATVCFNSRSEPQELLASLQQIERSLDRERKERWSARTLDLDLLLYDEAVIRTPSLRVPHPRMTFRPFVLEPACEIAADWLHPECGTTLGHLVPILELGRNAVALRGDKEREVSTWIEAERPEVAIETSSSDATPPRLTIDARRDPWPLSSCGPRLVLADCPREHWRDEVLAALECVWPSAS